MQITYANIIKEKKCKKNIFVDYLNEMRNIMKNKIMEPSVISARIKRF